jgi:hypothetical protein
MSVRLIRNGVNEKAWHLALILGVLHALFGLILQVNTRTLPWLDFDPWYSTIYFGGAYLITSFELFVAGAATVLLWRSKRLITPTIAATIWLLWGVYGTWTMMGDFPLTHFTPIQWMRPKPYPDYLLRATPLIGILAVSSLLEWSIQPLIKYVQQKGRD